MNIETARHVAARIWGDQNYSHIEMNGDLAEEIAKALMQNANYKRKVVTLNNGELTVTKIFSFCYAHKLPEYKGKCSNVHGHNSQLEVEIGANCPTQYNYPGMLIDFNELKAIVNEKIIDKLDHKFLNEDVDYFKVINPTVENMVIWIVNELEEVFGEALVRIRLYETPTSHSEWVRFE